MEIMTEEVWHASNDATRLATLNAWWATMMARYRRVNDVIVPGYQMAWLLEQATAAQPPAPAPTPVDHHDY